jgi:peroxiredoxin
MKPLERGAGTGVPGCSSFHETPNRCGDERMKRTNRVGFASRTILACGLALGMAATPLTARADDGDESVKAELAEMKKELSAMRADMKAILNELRQIKAAQKSAAKPRQRRKRPAMDLLGKPAPEVSFKTTSNEEVKIGGSSEKVKVAIFYASWCGFCKRALPGFQSLHEKYAGQDVEVMAISLDSNSGRRKKTEEEVIAHYEKLGLKMPLHIDPNKKIGGKYKVSSFPTSFVIGKNGVVEAVHIGGPKGLDKTIAAEVDKLLAGKSLVKKS